MTFDDELRDALTSYDPPRRTDFDLSQAIALAAPSLADDEATATPPVAPVPLDGHRHRRARKNRAAVGAVVLAVAAAVGIVVVAHQLHAGPTSVSGALGLHGARSGAMATGVDPHEVRARTEAKKLLEAFVPPAGASRTSDSTPLEAPAIPSSSPNTITLSHSWRLPGNATDLLTQLSAKPPTGMHAFGGGAIGFEPADGPAVHSLNLAPTGAPNSGFTAVLAPGVKGSLQLSMADIGDGMVVLRADAVTTWTPSRTSAEHVPTGPYRMTIAHNLGMNAGSTVRQVTVSDGAIVGQVATLLDGLEPGSARGVFCPWGDGELFDLTFTSRPGGPSVAAAIVNANGCRETTITINGKTHTYYPGSNELIALLERLDP